MPTNDSTSIFTKFKIEPSDDLRALCETLTAQCKQAQDNKHPIAKLHDALLGFVQRVCDTKPDDTFESEINALAPISKIVIDINNRYPNLLRRQE